MRVKIVQPVGPQSRVSLEPPTSATQNSLMPHKNVLGAQLLSRVSLFKGICFGHTKPVISRSSDGIIQKDKNAFVGHYRKL